MKKQLLATMAVIIVLTAFYTNIGNASPQTSVSFQSNGAINKTIDQGDFKNSNTVILRGLTLTNVNPNQNITAFVANYIGNYTFAPNMAVVIGDFHISGILQYPTQFNSSNAITYDGTGWDYTQIQTLINDFHSYGWKVILGSTGVAWEGQWVQAFIEANPELGFTDANGYTINDGVAADPNGNVAGNRTAQYNNLLPDLWANFSSAIPNLDISNNTRLIDVICKKLGQMISGGGNGGSGLAFDGFFGSDGWNGMNVQYYNLGQVGDNYRAVSFSNQEVTEWAQDANSGYGLPAMGGTPSGWNSWNITQRASWISTNVTAAELWYEWWCLRFSNMYLQIKDTIVANNPSAANFVGLTICGADASSQWSSGNLGGEGALNFTMVAQSGSITLFQTDPEVTESQIPQYDAYVNGLITSKNPSLTASIGIQAMSWTDWSATSLANMKEQYLSQVQNYVWYNGIQYPACNQTVFTIQYPVENPPGSSGINWDIGNNYPFWNNTAVHALFNFINSVNHYFLKASPIYLGNMFTIPDGSTTAFVGNLVFSNWQDSRNNFLITGGLYGDNNVNTNTQLNLYTSDTVTATIGRFTTSENPSVNGIAAYTCKGTDISYAIYSDNNGSIGSLLGQTASVDAPYSYAMVYAPLLQSIQLPNAYWLAITATNSRYYYAANPENENQLYQFTIPQTGTFPSTVSNSAILSLYGNPSLSSNDLVIYAFNAPEFSQMSSPFNSSQPLFDYKVFKSADGTIFIPVINMNDKVNGTSLSSNLTINLAALGLAQPAQDYSVAWESNASLSYSLSNSATVTVTLLNGADVLVISPK